MKSMLQEASSVVKAIEKAWTDAGKPGEFSIKVLENGAKNFIGWTTHPAVVSITYEPKRQGSKFSDSRQPAQNSTGIRPTRGQQGGDRFQQKNRENFRREPFKGSRPDGRSMQQQPRQGGQQPVQQQLRPNSQTATQQQSIASQQQINDQRREQQQEPLVWQPDWVTFISNDLKELLRVLEWNTNFTHKIDKKNLTIVFDTHLLEDQQEERAAFMGISYLMIQFLKRYHKKKFRGFQLTITVKTNNNDQSKTSGSIGRP